MGLMIHSDNKLQAADLCDSISKMWEASAPKLLSIEESCPPEAGAPVFTVNGKYTAKGWTEWTQGFQYGLSLIHI